MSISSVGPSAPVTTPDAAALQPQATKRNDTPADEIRARAEQPQPRAPLPPGQGTRIDVLA